MLESLSEAGGRDVRCIVRIHLPDNLVGSKRGAVEQSLRMLERVGCLIAKSYHLLSDFAVLDSIVWYGSILLLGNQTRTSAP